MNQLKILVIDDDPCLLSLIVKILEAEGYDTVENATNGLEGFEKYKALKPDLVLMDMDMPIMNGYESCRKIKQYNPLAKIILLTGNPQSDSAQKTISEGYAFMLFEKPFDIFLLLKVVRQLLTSQTSKVHPLPTDTGHAFPHYLKNLECA